MSLSEKSATEVEEMKVRAWKNRARGHPTRWRMLRDCVALLSLGWMSTFQIQMAMRRVWALKNRTTRDMLEELELEQSVKQVMHKEKKMFMWGSTEDGVAFWIRSVKNIPAGLVEVAVTSQLVSGFEV